MTSWFLDSGFNNFNYIPLPKNAMLNKIKSSPGSELFFIIFALALISCSVPSQQRQISQIGYDLSKPDKTHILPAALREISGLTIIDSLNVACIQDEKGIVFIYDLQHDRIVKEIYFNPNGDFEGICRSGDTIFAIKSNGELFKIKNYNISSFAEKIDLGFPKDYNIEGLCYDSHSNSLLISPKYSPGNKKKHPVFAFSLSSQRTGNDPLFTIKPVNIYKMLNAHKKGEKHKQSDDNRFNPSDIAVNPVTGSIFIISSVDHILVATDTTGDLEHAEKLDPILFNQPEGIAFFDNGDMLISNEGGDKYPTILRFNYKR
jgi:hypothetical protein